MKRDLLFSFFTIHCMSCLFTFFCWVSTFILKPIHIVKQRVNIEKNKHEQTHNIAGLQVKDLSNGSPKEVLSMLY